MQADSPIKMQVMSFDMCMAYSDYGEEEIIINTPGSYRCRGNRFIGGF